MTMDSKQLDEQRDDLLDKLGTARRNFFKRVGAGGVVASGAAGALAPIESFAYGGPYDQAFILDRNTTYMNIGTTGSTPRKVLRALDKNNELLARDPRASFNTQEMRNQIAKGFGADPNEIIMSFNTTDGMSKILSGIPWQPGDEIITTNMEHGGGNSPMQLQVDRRGVVLKRVLLPTNDAYSDAEVLARFQALLTNNTKAICFSSPPYLTGIRLPEKALCMWAASIGRMSI